MVFGIWVHGLLLFVVTFCLLSFSFPLSSNPKTSTWFRSSSGVFKPSLPRERVLSAETWHSCSCPIGRPHIQESRSGFCRTWRIYDVIGGLYMCSGRGRGDDERS